MGGLLLLHKSADSLGCGEVNNIGWNDQHTAKLSRTLHVNLERVMRIEEGRGNLGFSETCKAEEVLLISNVKANFAVGSSHFCIGGDAGWGTHSRMTAWQMRSATLADQLSPLSFF